MKQADEIKKIYEQAEIDTLGSRDKAVLEQMRDAYLTESQAEPKTVKLDIWRKIMTSRISKIAVAAVVIIAAVIGLNLLGLMGKGQASWADVIKPIFSAETVKYDMIIGQEGSGAVITDMVKGSKIRRTIEGVIQASIIDLASSKVMVLEEDTKTAIYIDLKNLPSTPNYVERLRNLITKLESSPEFEVKKLGEKLIDGKEAVGFLATCEGIEVTIWADAKTAIPIRIEQKEPNLNVICKNFQFDMEMDDSLFSMEVPAGYTLQQMGIDLTGSTEEDFITGLRLLAEINDGVFPQDISIEYFVKNAVQVGQKIDALKISDDEKLKEGEKLTKFAMFIRFFNVKNEGQWHYAGSGVQLGDATKAIFWYKPKDSQTWRVIYGNLSVKDVNEEDLP